MSKISEITRASNVASTDLILITGNVGGEQTSYAVEWKNCNDYYQQAVSVAKSGGDFSTIQSAIDSITDATVNKKYVVEVYPGTYTENVVCKPYVALKGMGGIRGVAAITNSSGNVVELPVSGSCGLHQIRVHATGTAKALFLDTGSTFEYQFTDCGFLYAQAGGYTDLIDLNSGESKFVNCVIDYVSTGTTTGSNYHRVVNIDGTASYYLFGCQVDASIQDADDILDLIEEAGLGSGEALIIDSKFHGYGTADVRGIDVEAPGIDRTIQSNHFHLTGNSAGVGTCYKMDNVASEIHSISNNIRVENFTNNYYANVASSAELLSHFDDIIAEEGSTCDGSIVLASSTFDGHMSMTNCAIQTYDATGGVDCNTLAGLAIPFDTEKIKDNMYTHSNSVNPSRITVSRTGLYRVSYAVTWSAGANNVDVSCYLRKEGTTESVATRSSAGQSRSGTNGSNTATCLVELTNGQYIEVMAERGGAVTTASNSVANRSWILLELIRGV